MTEMPPNNREAPTYCVGGVFDRIGLVAHGMPEGFTVTMDSDSTVYVLEIVDGLRQYTAQ